MKTKLTENDLPDIRSTLEDGGNKIYQFGKNKEGWLCVKINGRNATEYHNGDISDFWTLINADLLKK
tara:strand:+ start:131 stop:331 length:201 start_codon:yes stop_codon:yes gene_type:complete